MLTSFKNFLAEITNSQLANVGARINQYSRKDFANEPFNNIFGDKSRIVIPLLNEKMIQFKDMLSSLGMSNIDLSQGIGVVKTNSGQKERVVKIGKFLSQNGKEDWLNWWSDAKIKTVKNDVSIIISRHPIDIVRMSDHPELDSCHAPDGTFWKCAVQEAKTGGAIAFIVRNEELNKVKNLEAKNIFQDPDRGIEGIEPIERLRLRRYESDSDNYLVPIAKTYGIGHVGFYDTVKHWALNVQKDLLKNFTQEKYNKLKRRGGSYEDGGHDSSQAFSKFLDAFFTGGKSSFDQADESEKDDDNLEERIEELINGHHYSHFNVRAEVDQDVIIYTGEVSFFIDNELIIKELSTRGLRQEIESTLEDDIEIINNIDIHIDKQGYYINIDFNDRGEGTLESLEHFLDEVDNLDDKFDILNLQIIKTLVELEFIRNPIEAEFNFLKFDPDESCYNSDQVEIGNLLGLPKKLFVVSNNRIYVYGHHISINVNQASGIANYVDNYRNCSANITVFSEIDNSFEGKPLEPCPNIPIYCSLKVEIGRIQDLDNVKKVDDDFNVIIYEIKNIWKKFVAKYAAKDEMNPAVAVTISRLIEEFRKCHQNGNVVYTPDGYRYQDGNFDLPVKDALDKFNKDIQLVYSYKERMKMTHRYGEVVMQYNKDKPEYFWQDYTDRTTLPIEQALKHYGS